MFFIFVIKKILKTCALTKSFKDIDSKKTSRKEKQKKRSKPFEKSAISKKGQIKLNHLKRSDYNRFDHILVLIVNTKNPIMT